MATVRVRIFVEVRLRVRVRVSLTVQIKTGNHGTAAPTFWPMSIVVKRLDGSRCHLVWRYVSAHTTLC